jgi:hypothetical protein
MIEEREGFRVTRPMQAILDLQESREIAEEMLIQALSSSLFFTLSWAGDPLGRRAPAKGDACRRSVAFCVFAVMTAKI